MAVISFNQRLFAAADVGLNALRCRADIIISDNKPLLSADLTDVTGLIFKGLCRDQKHAMPPPPQHHHHTQSS